jgi:hypothetical protein
LRAHVPSPHPLGRRRAHGYLECRPAVPSAPHRRARQPLRRGGCRRTERAPRAMGPHTRFLRRAASFVAGGACLGSGDGVR